METFYIIKTRQYVDNGLDVYKIGFTGGHFNDRFADYPKGSIAELVLRIRNARKFERIAIAAFNYLFQQRKDHGTEYFEGNLEKMIDLSYDLINAVRNNKEDVFMERLQNSSQMVEKSTQCCEIEIASAADTDEEMINAYLGHDEISVEKEDEKSWISDWFYDNYEITNVEDDYVTCEDLFTHFTDSFGEHFSYKFMGIHLGKLVPGKKQKKINRHNYRVYFGVKPISHNDE